ncbi:MAG TPA: BatD family protein, partial [Ferruginibacter sp.]|nr:BatD family protein [Ferruginibacter sp.]
HAGSGGNAFNAPFALVDPFANANRENSYNDYILHKGESPLEKIKNNIIVKLETDKTSCYVGEPVVATYKLYTRLKSESSLSKNPSFNGFSVIDLLAPDDVNYQPGKLNGRSYNVYTLRKAQLYPLQAGTLELEPAEVENNIHFIKAEYLNQGNDPMDGFFRDFAPATVPPEGIENQKVTLQSQPLAILVKPLPEADKPANFGGAVGNFQVSASLAKNIFSTDDAGALTVVVSGTGNMQLVTAPDVKWADGIEAFEPKTSDDINKTLVPVSGRKLMEFPFTVSKAGNYTIPSVEFSYFDPKAGKYKTASSGPISFTVTQGTGKPKTVDTSTIVKNEPSALVRFFNNRLRVVSVVAILIVCGLIFWLSRERKKDSIAAVIAAKEEERKKEEAPVEAIIENQKNPLQDAETALIL